jgi:streptogramin lyase
MSRRFVRRPNTHGRSGAVFTHAASKAVELLEGRCLLSSVTTFPIPGQNADTFSWDGSAHIVSGPDGNLWFTDPGNGQIDRVTPQGQITPFPLPVHNGVSTGGGTSSGSGGPVPDPVLAPDDPSPDDIVAGPDGNLWFTESGADRIGRITPGGTITEFTTPTAGSNPTGIASGADGNVWFIESGTNDIGRIAPAGVITEFTTPNLDLSSTDNMVKGPGGDVWFIAFDPNGNDEIARVNTAGKVTASALNAYRSYPSDLTVGPDGNLYVADSGMVDRVDGAGAVTPFTIPDGSNPYAITVGSDGAIWFASDGINQLERMTPAGTFLAFSPPDPGATDGSTVSIGALATGPHGDLWFTDDQTPQVGYINPATALLASSSSPRVTAGTTSTETLASFVDFAGGSSASDFTATITWPDGSTSPGTIAANGTGGFDVSVNRDWSLDDDQAAVTITDVRDTNRAATASSYITANPPRPTGTGINVTSTAGELFSGTVASFTGVALNSLSSYSATIDWGDGQVSNGIISPNNTGGIDVSGSTRYPASGAYTIAVSLSPWPGGFLYPLGGGAGVAPVAVGVPEAQIAVPKGAAAATLDGRIEAHFRKMIRPLPVTTYPAIAGRLADDSVGVATTGPGRATPPQPVAATPAAVAAEPGIPIDPLPTISPGFANATSTMTAAPGVMDGTGFTIRASSTAPFSGTVASFKLADANADLSQFHATVTWSDDQVYDWFTCRTPPTTGAITSDGQGRFTVAVSNLDFPSFGLSHFTVSISNDRIASGDATVGVAYGQLCVDSPIRWLPVLRSNGANAPTGASRSAAAYAASTAADNVNPALSEQVVVAAIPLKPSPGGHVAGTIGVITGVTAATKNLADLHGTIHWGDGATSLATFVRGSKGKILVRGAHHFAPGGSFAVSVDVQQTLYENGKPSALYPLALPAIQAAARVRFGPITTGGIAISAVAKQPFSGTVAAFTAPDLGVAVTRSASIFWGDGTRSAGTIDANGSDLTVTGAHTYRRAGKYAARVVVTQKSTQRGLPVPVVVANIPIIAAITAT